MSIKETIQKTVSSHKVVVYMKGTPAFPQCGFSAQTIDLLKKVGAPLETVNVLADQEVREGVKAFTNWPTIPQVFINGQFVGGCDIVKQLYTSGELKRLVDDAVAK